MKDYFKTNLEMILLDYVDGEKRIWNFIIKFSINYIPYIKNKIQSYESINELLCKYYASYKGQ
jgi:hypothetical protein